MKKAQPVVPALVLSSFGTSQVQVTYRSPFGAAAAAGNEFTRKAVSRSDRMSATVDTAFGLLHVAPPSVDLTIHSLLSWARRVEPSQKTYRVPSGPTTGCQ